MKAQRVLATLGGIVIGACAVLLVQSFIDHTVTIVDPRA